MGKRKFKAFTLLEMLIVITIIGILMAIGMAGIPKLMETANKKALEAEINNFKIAIFNFQIDNGVLPASVDDLLNGGYITAKLAEDPWNVRYQLRHNSETGIFEIISAGPDKKFGSEDDIVSKTSN